MWYDKLGYLPSPITPVPTYSLLVICFNKKLKGTGFRVGAEISLNYGRSLYRKHTRRLYK